MYGGGGGLVWRPFWAVLCSWLPLPPPAGTLGGLLEPAWLTPAGFPACAFSHFSFFQSHMQLGLPDLPSVSTSLTPGNSGACNVHEPLVSSSYLIEASVVIYGFFRFSFFSFSFFLKKRRQKKRRKKKKKEEEKGKQSTPLTRSHICSSTLFVLPFNFHFLSGFAFCSSFFFFVKQKTKNKKRITT